MTDPIRVALLPSDDGGCGFYRVLQPFDLLQRQGHASVTVRRAVRDGEPGPFCLLPQDIESADVIVIQRQGGISSGLPLEDLVHQRGRRIIYEIDDDIGNLTKDNPAHREFSDDPGWWDRATRLMRQCAGIVTTTSYLAGELARFSERVWVAPNGVDLDMWRPAGWVPAHERAGDTIRIGYIASRHHVEDARKLIKPWRDIARRFPAVQFVLAGAFYPCLKEALGDRMEFHDGVPIAQYAPWCRSLRLDIAVAPLENSRFARSKSNLKALEATAIGVPIVCSAVEPYRHMPVPLARDQDEMAAQIAVLCDSESGRQRRADAWSAADAWVREHGTAQVSADAWMTAIRQVMA